MVVSGKTKDGFYFAVTAGKAKRGHISKVGVVRRKTQKGSLFPLLGFGFITSLLRLFCYYAYFLTKTAKKS